MPIMPRKDSRKKSDDESHSASGDGAQPKIDKMVKQNKMSEQLDQFEQAFAKINNQLDELASRKYIEDKMKLVITEHVLESHLDRLKKEITEKFKEMDRVKTQVTELQRSVGLLKSKLEK